MNIFEIFGKFVMYIIDTLGGLAVFFARTVKWAVKPPYRFDLIVKQMEHIGVRSLPVVILTGFFTGMVFSYQIYYGFAPFGAEAMGGMVVTVACARELSPVLGSIMVTARSGSAIAAELGTMRVTEQIDALDALAIESMQFLIVPRVVAGLLVMPVLSLVALGVSMLGAYLVSVPMLGTDSALYLDNISTYVKIDDVLNGVMKSAVFGVILTLVGCYKGYNTRGGALGVGKSTTEAVVVSCVLILSADFIMTTLTTVPAI